MDEAAALLAVVPRWIVAYLGQSGVDHVEEIELDLGRPPRVHRRDGDRPAVLPREVAPEDLQYVIGRVTRFRDDNRTGIERTLHRVACIRDRYHEIVGFTFRVGRAIDGAALPLRDLLAGRRNLLLVGRPGAGKTTILRGAAAILSDRLHRRVVIADTSNEIGGDGQIPHPAIGSARRLQIPLADPNRPDDAGDRQAAVILQAVINHRAETIIVDELGFASDARTARSIAHRGIQLIATAHGSSLRDVVFNAELACLIGDLHTVLLTQEEIERSGAARHTIQERTGPPVFDCAVEIVRRDLFLVHPDVAASVDAILKGLPPPVLRRSAFENPTNGEERARIGDAQISFGEAKPLGRDSPCSEAL
jgi:stage III sporulation protein SpoIIIAA